MLELWKGNEAMAEAAIRAGLQLYVGYPITPQSEICEYMSGRMPEVGRHFIQSESEIISINTILGSAIVGARSMTSSSSVGISLMQEGMTACFAKGLPIVLIQCKPDRGGMGRDFGGGQTDYLRETRGGGNGDYRVIVFVPNSIQEAVEMTYNAFDVAEKWRNPVEIMTEGRLGQMMESIELPGWKEGPKQEWAIDGTQKPYDLGNGVHYAEFKDRIDRMRERGAAHGRPSCARTLKR
jgi:2-oxoglutarate ferredoxin oxidoreductase subunit alpha